MGSKFEGSALITPVVVGDIPLGLYLLSAESRSMLQSAGAPRGWECVCTHEALDLAGTDSSLQQEPL